MKLLILGKSSPEIAQNILKCLQSNNSKWIVVSSFQINEANWKDDKFTFVNAKKMKQLDTCTNIIFDFFIGTLSTNFLVDVENVIIISQKPDVYFPLVSFSDIFISQTKSSSKLLHFYNLLFESKEYTFDMFKDDNTKSNFLYFNKETKKPIKVNDFQTIKDQFEKIRNPSNSISSNQHLVNKTNKLCIQLTLISSCDVVKKEIETMCSENLISKMLISCKFIETPNSLSCDFYIRKKRFDLFGILLLNMLRALTESGKVTKACIFV